MFLLVVDIVRYALGFFLVGELKRLAAIFSFFFFFFGFCPGLKDCAACEE